MEYIRTLLLIGIAGLSLFAGAAQAAEEDAFLQQISAPSEQSMGHGRSAIWTLPLATTQFHPSKPTPAMHAASQAQHEGRFLDAMILLDEASKGVKADTDTGAELSLLRSSLLLEGNQHREALEVLAPLFSRPRYAADAYALTAMAHLQQGKMQEALDAARHAHELDGILPHLALSYALQGSGQLAEARNEMASFNAKAPASAVALAREAELALTLDHIHEARSLAQQAQHADPAHPYVVAVNGLVYLIDGEAQQAKTAFETALKRDPRDAKALLGLGLAEIKLGNFRAGHERLQAANDADPGNALILTYLGRSQLQLGQTEAARASWRSAQQADPKDPVPWLYQAQAQLLANRPQESRESLREAQARLAYRSVYRGERLLKEDEQLLQANLAEVQRQLGLEQLAFQSLSASVGEKSSANLKDQASLLQGQRFGESARRSLLLQSQFNDRPGNLPPELDVYGDGAGQTGAATPQHGVVSGLGAQQASYNNYDELFSQPTTLEVDATAASHHTLGEQVRLGVGNDTLGLSLAQRSFKTDGNAPFEDLDNRMWQGIVQWRPLESTQMFVSHQSFNSQHGETFQPAFLYGYHSAIEDVSTITRLGLRHNLSDDDELRGLWSRQQTEQVRDNLDFFVPPNAFSQSGSDRVSSAELQYRRGGVSHAIQLGMLQTRGNLVYWDTLTGSVFTDDARVARQYYFAWQQTLDHAWQLDAGLGWGKIETRDDTGGVNNLGLARWLPRLGMVFAPDSATHVRVAVWRSLGIYGVGDATLAPVSLAGFLLSRPGDNGQLVQAAALGGDRQLNPNWLITAEIQQRQTDQPVVLTAPDQDLLRTEIDEARLALHWQPQGTPWAASLAYEDERIQNDQVFVQDSVQEQHLRSQQLALRWFASAQWTANLTWSHNQVAGRKQYDIDLITFGPASFAHQDSFNQVDADLNWKFSRDGSLTAGVRNAADARMQYTEIDKLNPRFSSRRLVYAKIKLGW
ncbi:MAG: TonB-dependent receptor [Gammaproteobacteria bacterium]|nr:TonB-dependent receptor [Gammaproteobacteria bacterium]MBU1777483.1 TonB-dependent receptor [Gammaproteobacteria bacterium]MBU1969541.1 TonB-dependent receptor [Gammaproteobacteria bacterium]